jgi:helix-turn-helix protein
MESHHMPSTPVTRQLQYLSNDEAAVILKLSPRTLEKFRVIGGGPRYRKFGRRVVYTAQDLEVWADARTCDSTSDYVVRRNPS